MLLRLVPLIWIPYLALGITFVLDAVCAYIYISIANISFFDVPVALKTTDHHDVII